MIDRAGSDWRSAAEHELAAQFALKRSQKLTAYLVRDSEPAAAESAFFLQLNARQRS